MENFQELHIEHDFWDDFIVEAFEHIDEIESNAMSLEQNPEEMEIINTMFRAFHTIKGLSGFVEHSIIQEVAHKTETMMDYCRKGELKVNTRIVDAILKASDYIKQLCESVDAYRDENLIYQIQALLVDLEEIAEGDKPAEDFVELHVETPDEFKEVSGEPQESKYLEKESQPEEIQQEEIFSEEAPQEEFKVETESEFFSNEGNSESEAESEAEIKLEGLDAFAMEVSEAFDIEETEKTEQDEESD